MKQSIYTPFISDIPSPTIKLDFTPPTDFSQDKPISLSVDQGVLSEGFYTPQYNIQSDSRSSSSPEEQSTPKPDSTPTSNPESHLPFTDLGSEFSIDNFTSLLKQQGIDVRVTSGLRPGAKTKQGKQSFHATGKALDIVPIDGNFNKLRQQISQSPVILNYMRKHGIGILDETTPEVLARTGGTGAHWHIGPDRVAVSNFNNWFPGVQRSKLGGILKFQNSGKIKQTSSVYNPLIQSNDQATVPLIMAGTPAQPQETTPYFGEFYKPQYNIKQEAPSTNHVERGVTQEFKSIADKYNKETNIKNAVYLYDRLIDEGFDDKQAKVIVSQSILESGVNPRRQQTGGPGYGLIQWEGKRKEDMLKHTMSTETSWPDKELDRQIDYLITELRDPKQWLHGGKGTGYSTGKEAYDRFYNGQTSEDLIHSLTHSYIRNADRQKRIDSLTNILNTWA